MEIFSPQSSMEMILIFNGHGAIDKVVIVTIGILSNYLVGTFQI